MSGIHGATPCHAAPSHPHGLARTLRRWCCYTQGRRRTFSECHLLVVKDVGHVEVTPFDGLLVDYVGRSGAHAIIRGLRAISDFEHEFQMALVNRKLAKTVETVFLMPSEEYSYLSSTIIKDVAQHGGGLVDFLHPEVARRLQDRIRSLKP